MKEENGKDPLFGNKAAAALLTAGLLIFGLPQLTKALMGGGHHGGEAEELHLAYCCVDLETGGGGGAEAAPVFDLGTALAKASVAGGERRAALCKSCHTFEQGGANGTGPNLWNVVNRPVASVSGFNYTSALKEAGGAWTYERLDAFLKNSQEYIPGTAMVQRFSRDSQRAEILAYLGSLSSSPAPYPAPAVIEEPTQEHAEESAEEAAGAVEEADMETAEEIIEDATDH